MLRNSFSLDRATQLWTFGKSKFRYQLKCNVGNSGSLSISKVKQHCAWLALAWATSEQWLRLWLQWSWSSGEAIPRWYGRQSNDKHRPWTRHITTIMYTDINFSCSIMFRTHSQKSPSNPRRQAFFYEFPREKSETSLHSFFSDTQIPNWFEKHKNNFFLLFFAVKRGHI